MEKIKLTKLLTLITLVLAILASPVIAQISSTGSDSGEPYVPPSVGSWTCPGGNQSIGDVNNDGRVTQEDVDFLSNSVLGTSGYPTQSEISRCCAADVNHDGEIDAKDVAFISKYLNNIDGYCIVSGMGTCNNPNYVTAKEICNDGIDNDCDGLIDKRDNDCSSYTCTDSDGGKNYYVKGSAIKHIHDYNGINCLDVFNDYCIYIQGDYCTNSKTLKEAYCDGDEVKNISYICPNGCKDGACIKENESRIHITNPIDEQAVSGIVPVKATASGPNELKEMYLLIPGSGGKEIIQIIPLTNCVEGVGISPDSSRIYSKTCQYQWDTAHYAGEKVTLTASITDISGSEARDSATVAVSGGLTCNQKCKSLGYAYGTCRSWSIYPDAEQCKADEINVGHTTDCEVQSGIIGIGKGCCCKKATSGISLHVSTDKYTYRLKESVKITARISIQNRVIHADEFKIKADIHNPDGSVESIQLANTQPCICATCACEQGAECNCAPFCSCTYIGTYYRTDKQGGYTVSATAASSGGEKATSETRFRVTDTGDHPPEITDISITPNTPTAAKEFKVYMSATDDIGLNSIAFYKVKEPIYTITEPIRQLTATTTSSGAIGGGQGIAISVTTTASVATSAQSEPIAAYTQESSTGVEEDESTGIVLVDEVTKTESSTEPTEEEINKPELIQSQLIAYKYAHNCNSETKCAHTWAVTETQPGRHTYKFVAYDTSGQKAVQYKTFYVQPLQTQYVHLDEKFTLNIGETAHIIDYNNMQIKLNNILYPRCAATGQEDDKQNIEARCIGEKPYATLEIINPQTDTAQTSTSTLVRMSAGETKEVFGAEITLLQLDSKTGIFIVRKATQSDFVDIEIEPETRTISYDESAEYKVTVTDKHPQLVQADCDDQNGCPDAPETLYTYDIIVQNLPFQKEYPKTMTLQAGTTDTFTLKVTPFQVTTSQKEIQILKAVPDDNAITAQVTARPVEVVISSPKIMLQRKYTFSVTAKQKNSPYVRDTDSATLVIEPDTQPPMPPSEETTIQLYKGWNLISLPGKLVQFIELTGAGNKKLLGFVYLPEEKRYVTIKEAQKILGDEFYEYLAKHAFWIYSYDDSKLRLKVNRNVSYNELELYSGWNLLPVTEDMVGGYLNEIKGTCNFEKLYQWTAKDQKWKEIEEDYKFQESEINYGIAIKATDYCRLGGGNIIEPPPMPEE